MQRALTIISIGCIIVWLACCLYLVLLRRTEKKLDRSIWIFCGECNVKWRPTVCESPTPSDYCCPKCGNTINTFQSTDEYNRMPIFVES